MRISVRTDPGRRIRKGRPIDADLDHTAVIRTLEGVAVMETEPGALRDEEGTEIEILVRDRRNILREPGMLRGVGVGGDEVPVLVAGTVGDLPVLRPRFEIVGKDRKTGGIEIDRIGRRIGGRVPLDRDRLPRREDLTPGRVEEVGILGGETFDQVAGGGTGDDRLAVHPPVEVFVGQDQGIDRILEGLIARIGGEEEVALEEHLEHGVASHLLVEATERRRPVAAIVVFLARRSGIGPDIRSRTLVRAVDPAQRLGAPNRGSVGDGVPVCDRGPLVIGLLIIGTPMVEVEHPGQEVAESLPHGPLLRAAPRSPARDLVVLDRMAVLVEDHIGILGIIDAPVPEVEALVARAVEGVVVRKVVRMHRDRTVVDIIEAECLLDVALDRIDRVIDDRFLERILRAGEIEDVGGGAVGIGRLTGRFVRTPDAGGAEIDVGADQHVVREAEERHLGAGIREGIGVGVSVVEKGRVVGILHRVRVVDEGAVVEDLVPLLDHLAAVGIDEDDPVTEGLAHGP